MSIFIWLALVWVIGLAGVIAAGFGIAIVNADIAMKIRSDAQEMHPHASQGFRTLDILGYRSLHAHAALPRGVEDDLKTLRRWELAMACAGITCAGVLAGCWLLARAA
jgi:hypothetical protein